MTAKSVARMGVLTAAALVLGYIESFIPLVPGVPGIKLGLANTVLLYAVYTVGVSGSVLLMLAKVALSGFLFAGVSGMLYSLAGGALSLAVMLLVKKIRGVSVVGVSVAGACAHNIGQLAVAAAVIGVRAASAFAPALLSAALIAGLITGFAAKYVIKGLEHARTQDKK